jgi:YVTN family beta-propeller protein
VLAALWLAMGVSSASAAAVVKTIPAGSEPFGVSSDGTHVWVTNSEGDGTVSEIDASTGTVVNTITVGSLPYAVSSDGTHVWVTNLDDDTVSEIDASTGTVVNTITVGDYPWGVSSDGTHVWVANNGDDTVSEIDASTGTVVKTITVGGLPTGVSSDGTHVWVTNEYDGTVSEIDASTGTVVNTITVGSDPLGVSSDGTHVWVTNAGDQRTAVDDTVSEIDASTGTVVKTITVGNGAYAYGVSSDGTHVWVTNANDDTVSEIDASTGTVVNTIPVGSLPVGVSSDGTHVWVANTLDGTVSEIQISAGSTAASTSPPSIAGNAAEGQMLTEAHGSWTNSPTSFKYQWEDCDSSGNSCTAITGATGQTYKLAVSDVGHTIRVTESASNAGGSSAPASSHQTAVVIPSAAQLKASLLGEITPHGKAAKIAALLKAHGYVLSFTALSAGKVVIDWYYLPNGAHVASAKAKPVLIAAGNAKFSQAGRVKIKIKLTAHGRQLLKHSKRLTLTARDKFTPTAQHGIIATKKFKLTR